MCAGAFVFAFAGGAEQAQVLCGEGGLELGAVVLPVGDEGLPGPGGGQGGVGGEDGEQGLAFVGFGAGQVSAKAMGRPPRVATRCRRRPQK